MKSGSHFVLCVFLLLSTSLAAQDTGLTNTVGMQFVLVQPGSFTMAKFDPPYPKQPAGGSQSENGYREKDFRNAEAFAKKDALPGFTATISKPFYIGRFEVTQRQWKKVMGTNPSVFQKTKVTDPDDHPVENVSWEDAQKFLAKLNQLEKGKKYRLPTEQEWEYAARAGSSDDIPWSEIQQTAQLGTRTTNKVGQKKANAWGLYDMLGNVWEWVEDYYNEEMFAEAVPPKSGKVHVLKGASFTGDVKNATYMTHAAGPGNGWDVGFRVVMEVGEQTVAVPQHIPAGFTSLFNGIDLSAWHVSGTSHQGTTPDCRVEDNSIVLRENPFGQGGILLTNKKYKSFELYLEAKIDSFCNGGIFLRSTESGQAYQIELSEPGGTGSLLGERMDVSKGAEATKRNSVWKPNDWNSFRVRMTGEIPTITLWINEVQMWQVTEPVNDFIAGATSGMIGLQAHWSATFSQGVASFDMSGSWRPDGAHRFRNIAIKELK